MDDLNELLEGVNRELGSLLPYDVRINSNYPIIRVYYRDVIVCRLAVEAGYMSIYADLGDPIGFTTVKRYELGNPNDFDIHKIADFIKELGWKL